MGFVLNNTSLEVVLYFLLVLFITYWYFTQNYDFWAQRGVPYRPAVFPFGSMKDLVLGKMQMGNAYDEVYREFVGQRYCGVVELRSPILVIRDPDLIKQILIKDFDCFVDRAAIDINPRESIQKHLFQLDGEEWRDMRHRLSPAFSSGKMKNMFVLMKKCGEQLRECLQKHTDLDTSINVKEISAKFTMDIIATCAFGLEINSLLDENTEFFKTGMSIFQPTKRLLINYRIISLFPLLAKTLNIQRLSERVKEMLYTMVSNTVEYREKNNVSRNDFLDILIKLKNNKSIDDDAEEGNEPEKYSDLNRKEGLTLDQMTAQAFIFFIAGFETASSTMTFCLFELAHNQDVQDRLHQELEEVLRRHDGQITYQSLHELKYMNQVIDETLRMYASLSVIHRRCTRTYRIPDSDLVLQKGQKVYIPTYAIHHDPEYYPEPYKFDPERFTPEKAKARHPCLHLPFGSGPRNCIGMRFGMMQTKIGLSTFMSQFRVEVTPETPFSIELSPVSFVTQPKRPVFLKVTRR